MHSFSYDCRQIAALVFKFAAADSLPFSMFLLEYERIEVCLHLAKLLKIVIILVFFVRGVISGKSWHSKCKSSH